MEPSFIEECVWSYRARCIIILNEPFNEIVEEIYAVRTLIRFESEFDHA